MRVVLEWTVQAVVMMMVVVGFVDPTRWSAGEIALFAMLGLQLSRRPDAPWLFRVKS